VTKAGMSHPIVVFLARWRVRLGVLVVLASLMLARPTWETWRWGLGVAILGEALRVWAAGHLEKSREVTRSGPYRWMQHPLYAGSAVIAAGVVIASRSPIVGALAAIYMITTITAAVRTEAATLRAAFGGTYDDYRASRGNAMQRRFSAARVMRNREYRAAVGVVAGFALLALRLIVHL
jgi:protein-S-isoprenylcysteine O-methyltransferase Ste14